MSVCFLTMLSAWCFSLILPPTRDLQHYLLNQAPPHPGQSPWQLRNPIRSDPPLWGRKAGLAAGPRSQSGRATSWEQDPLPLSLLYNCRRRGGEEGSLCHSYSTPLALSLLFIFPSPRSRFFLPTFIQLKTGREMPDVLIACTTDNPLIR